MGKSVDFRPPICDYEGSDYQRTFWERGQRTYEDEAEALALRRLLPGSGMRLLELGAGAGRNSPRYRGFEQVVLLDASRSQLRQAKERLGGQGRYRYVVGDIYRLPFTADSFDAATMIRTLHHMAEPGAALAQVRRALAPSAVFILEFANKRHLKAIGRWLIRRQAWNPFSREPVEFVALNFNFHPEAVGEWLRAAGFRVVRRLSVSHFRWGWLKQRISTRLLLAGESLLQWTGAWFPWTPSVFIEAVATDLARERRRRIRPPGLRLTGPGRKG